MTLDTCMEEFTFKAEPIASLFADGDGGKAERKTQAAPRVLVAEDDYELRLLITQALQRHGYDVIEVKDGWQLQQRLEFSRVFFGERWDFDLMVSDIRMPGMGGMEALAAMQDQPTPPPVILITAFGDREAYARAARLGALAFFDKPIDLDEFCAYVQRILPPPEGTNGTRGA